MKTKLFSCIGILFVFCLLGCTGGSLVGRWVEVDDPDRFYVFLEDGTGIDNRDILLKWSIPETNKLNIKFEGFSENGVTDNYWLSGSKLILGGVEYRKRN